MFTWTNKETEKALDMDKYYLITYLQEQMTDEYLNRNKLPQTATKNQYL